MSLAHQVCNLILEPAAANPTGEPSVPFVLALTQPDGATGPLDWTLPNYPIPVIDAVAVKPAANGAAVNTTQVQTAAAAVVSSAMDLNVVDPTISRTLTLDDAN